MNNLEEFIKTVSSLLVEIKTSQQQILEQQNQDKQRVVNIKSQTDEKQNSDQNVQQEPIQNLPLQQESQIQNLTKRTQQEKIQIGYEAYIQNNNIKISDKYKISECSVRNYKKLYEKSIYLDNGVIQSIKQQKKSKKKIPRYKDMEEQLILWMQEERLAGKPLNQQDIKDKALKLCPDKTFKASNGWFDRFKKRNKVSYRASTHIIQKCADDVSSQIKKFLDDIYQLKLEMAKLKKKVLFFNIDETPCQIKTQVKTFDFQGKKQIDVKGVKYPKNRFTIIAMVDSNGNVYPPLIINKGVNASRVYNKDPTECILVQNQNSWVTESIYLLYLKSLITNIKYNLKDTQLCLIHDKCTSHTTTLVSNLLKKHNIKEFLIPAGTTPILQVLDVGVNKVLKQKIQEQFKLWMDKEFNEGQQYNPKFQDYVQWILNSLKQIQKETIINTFKYCGITNNLDRSEDHLINKLMNDTQNLQAFYQQIMIENNEDNNEVKSDILKMLDPNQYYVTYIIEDNQTNTTTEQEMIVEQNPIIDIQFNQDDSDSEENQSSEDDDFEQNLTKKYKKEHIDDDEKNNESKMEVERQYYSIEEKIEKKDQANILKYNTKSYHKEFIIFLDQYYIELKEQQQDIKNHKTQTTINSFFSKKN